MSILSPVAATANPLSTGQVISWGEQVLSFVREHVGQPTAHINTLYDIPTKNNRTTFHLHGGKVKFHALTDEDGAITFVLADLRPGKQGFEEAVNPQVHNSVTLASVFAERIKQHL